MKYALAPMLFYRHSRSREGAWIEIMVTVPLLPAILVAPVRERGLKLMYLGEFDDKTCGRSREGAWIEIPLHRKAHNVLMSLP